MSSYGNDPRPGTWSGEGEYNQTENTGGLGATPPIPGEPGYGTVDPGPSAGGGYSSGSHHAGSDGGDSTKDVAKQEASEVKDTAVQRGQDVAGTAKDEAANVAHEAKERAGDVVGNVMDEVRGQAGSQQQRLAGGLHSVASELGEMASKSEQSGPGSQLAQEASRRIGAVGHWLEDREPADVLDEVRDFARRRPVVFLTGAALAGLVVGRLTRDVAASKTSLDSGSPRRQVSGTGGSQTGGSWDDRADTYGATRTPGATAAPYGTADPYSTAEPYGTPDPYGTTSGTVPAAPGSATGRPASLTEEDMTDGPATRPGEDPWLNPREGTR